MCNPAKFTIRLGLFLRKKRWANCFTLGNKVALMATLLAMCFIFFVIKIEGFFAGMAAATLPPSSWFTGRRGSHDCKKTYERFKGIKKWPVRR